MNRKIKHGIIIVFSLTLVLATVFIPVRLEKISEVKAAKLGYPIHFLVQDFSSKYGNHYFFPTWEEFSFERKLPLVGFSMPGLAADFIVSVIGCEIFFYILETIDFALRKNRNDNN